MDVHALYNTLDVNSLDPSHIHPIFNLSHSLLSAVSIQWKENHNHIGFPSSFLICLPVSGSNTTVTLFSSVLPLRSVSGDAFPLLHSLVYINLFSYDQNAFPLYASMTVIVQTLSTDSATTTAKRFIGVFPKGLRYSQSGKVLFYPVFNCTLVGGKRSCVFYDSLFDYSFLILLILLFLLLFLRII